MDLGEYGLLIQIVKGIVKRSTLNFFHKHTETTLEINKLGPQIKNDGKAGTFAVVSTKVFLHRTCGYHL
jgi:hypothetical protein